MKPHYPSIWQSMKIKVDCHMLPTILIENDVIANLNDLMRGREWRPIRSDDPNVVKEVRENIVWLPPQFRQPSPCPDIYPKSFYGKVALIQYRISNKHSQVPVLSIEQPKISPLPDSQWS